MILDSILYPQFSAKERFRKSEVCEILGLSERSVENLEQAGLLNPVYTSDRKKFYTKADLESYLTKISRNRAQ